jgi:glycine/D-amino acid oxidase-like deaminating enzyme
MTGGGRAPDVAVVGAGIAGCATAAFLAEAGAAVALYERAAIAAGASGRNSGIVQHPLDTALTGLYEASLELYATLGHGFELPAEPSGVLLVSHDPEPLARDFEAARAAFPELEPEWLEGEALRSEEPALARGLHAYRLSTGRPVGPTAATRGWAERARAAGARFELGRDVRAADLTASAVVVAAGPWTPEALGARPAWRPVYPNWGVVAQVRLERPPRHSLEQAGIEALTAPGGAAGRLFSLVTAGGASAVGSTFDPEPPEPEVVAPSVLEHAARFVPALAGAAIDHVRACARPLSADGRPLLGPVADDLHLVTGHGPWGVTLGPGSARLVARSLLHGEEIPPELAAARFGAP